MNHATNHTNPTRRPTWLPATLAAGVCVGFASLAGVAAPATTPATTQSNPADAILDRLLDTPRPTTDAGPGRPLSAERFAGGMDDAAGTGPDVIAPDTAPQRLVREGSYVVDRLGFASKSADGASVEFVFAADGTSPAAAADPPMVLVPNLNLMALENAAAGAPDRRFRVTGRVTEYRGRNHLLLEKVVVLR